MGRHIGEDKNGISTQNIKIIIDKYERIRTIYPH